MRLLSRVQRACFADQCSVKELFQSRSLFYQSTSQELEKIDFFQKFSAKSVYCGYDPTSDSLHLGNLVSIIMMSRLSLMGLKPIFLVGGATGLIGDPSGKSKQRNLLDETEVTKNIEYIHKQIKGVYQKIQEVMMQRCNEFEINKADIELSLKNQFKMKNNYEFYEGMNAIRYLRDVGKYFRMGPLLSREAVSGRLKSEQGISYAEFSYSIIQAYDFYRLHEEEGCVLQFGGSDQWGNITNGCDLVRKKTGKDVFGMTMPLLLTKSGKKFGKSQGNALFLNPQKTPLDEVYKYLFNASDDEVQKYLLIFTFYSKNKITEILKIHNQSKDKRYAQTILAQSVIQYLGEYVNQNKQFFKLTHEQLKAKERDFFVKIFTTMQKNQQNYIYINRRQLLQIDFERHTISDLLVKLQLAKSKTEIRREVQKGGLYLNNRKIDIAELNQSLLIILKQNLLYEQFLILRKGKKTYKFLHFSK